MQTAEAGERRTKVDAGEFALPLLRGLGVEEAAARRAADPAGAVAPAPVTRP